MSATRPMGGRLAAVEQARFGQERDAGADAGDVGAAGVPFAQPGQQRRCGGRCGRAPPSRSAQTMMMSVWSTSRIARSGVSPSAADAAHRSPSMRGGANAEARLRRFAMQPVPEHAGGVEDLDRSDRRRRIAAFEQDDGDIEHAVVLVRGRRRLKAGAVQGCDPFGHARSPMCGGRRRRLAGGARA